MQLQMIKGRWKAQEANTELELKSRQEIPVVVVVAECRMDPLNLKRLE